MTTKNKSSKNSVIVDAIAALEDANTQANVNENANTQAIVNTNDAQSNANDKTQTTEQTNAKVSVATRDVFNNNIMRMRSHQINMTILNAFARNECLTVKQIEAMSAQKAVRAHIAHLMTLKHVYMKDARVIVHEETHKQLYEQREKDASKLKFIK